MDVKQSMKSNALGVKHLQDSYSYFNVIYWEYSAMLHIYFNV